jgi:exosortase
MISTFLKRPLLLIPAILTAIVLGYIYFEGLSVLILQWIRLDQYWRFLIIPVSLFFIWNQQKDLRATLLRPSIFTGIALIIPGCLAYILWKIALVDFFIETGLFLLTLGFISLIFGNRLARLFLLPLGYLVLMTSIIERVLSPITVLMQYASAIATSFFMSAFGWDILRDGRLLRLPGTVLEVASECSGVGQLTALIAFSIPLGVLLLRSMFPKVLLLLMTFPLALMVNTIRIILICLWNYNGLKSAIHGPYEILRMPFIYPLALVLLYLFALFLSRIERKKGIPESMAPKVGPQKSPSSIASALCVGLGLSILPVVGVRCIRTAPAHFISSLQEFPMVIGACRGENIIDSSISFYFGKPDETVSRKYRTADGAELSLYIARFNGQNPRKRISSVESPLFAKDERRIELQTGPDKVIKAKLTASENNFQLTTLSWFDVDGVAFPTIDGVRKKIAVNTIRMKRNNATLVAVSFDEGKSGLGEEVLRSFVVAIYPQIKKILAIE